MRERMWLRLRENRWLRQLAALPLVGSLVRAASWWLVPSYRPRRLQVQSGLGAGLWLELNPRWESDIWRGTYESVVQQAIEPLLQPGATFYDVGCGPGFFSLVAARRGVNVLAFEADERILDKARRHAAWNHLEQSIRFVHCAVYSYSGTIRITPATHDRGHGNAQVRAARNGSELAAEVRCTTLDEFLANHTAPDVVKLDVEGAESEVLKGAVKLFRTCRPVLLCEVHDEQNRCLVEAWLRECEYQCRWLEPEERLPRHLLALPSTGRAG